MKTFDYPVWIKFLGKTFSYSKIAIDSLHKILICARNNKRTRSHLPHVMFLKDQKILSESGQIIKKIQYSEKREVYKNYRQWCVNNGNIPLSRTHFYSILQYDGIVDVKTAEALCSTMLKHDPRPWKTYSGIR